MEVNFLGTLNWQKITKIDELGFQNVSNKYQFIAKEFKYVFFFRPDIVKVKKTDEKILFLKSLNRPDYNDLFEMVYSTCHLPKKKKLDIKYVDARRIRVFPLFVLLKNILVYKHAIRPSLLTTILLIIKITKYLEVYERTKTYKPDILVVFADMQPVDNMLVQIANLQGVRTVTMQHGLYVDYKDFPTENAVNYLHAVSNTFLAWGQDSANLINRHHPSITTQIVGKPTKVKPLSEKKEYFTVVFDSNYFMQHNLELLKIAYEMCHLYNLKVNIKFHPYNNKRSVQIEENITLIDADIMSSQFVLGHTTTMLYDCMNSGVPSFRYKTNKPSIDTLDKLEFSNSSECIEILNNPQIMNLDFKVLAKKYFSYDSTESKSKYTEFFNSLVNIDSRG